MDQHINVTCRMNGASHDLRIPTRMEVRRLIRELDQIFGSAMEPRSKYQLRVVNKGILLDEGKVVQEYPITSGDLIEIEEW